LVPVAEEAQRRLAGVEGAMAFLDPWRVGGWLDPVSLEEHLAPEAGGLPQRLQRRQVTAWVAKVELGEGRAQWHELAHLPAAEATAALVAACTFPGGWAARGETTRAWGGVGVLPLLPPVVFGEASEWDVVCGFPLPPAPRSWLGGAVWEQLQRRDEVAAAWAVTNWGEAAAPGTWRLVAPTAAGWRRAEGREDAELGVEYPLPWERNGELARRLVAAGALAVACQAGEA